MPRAKHRAIAILAKRDKTEKELRDKLQQSLTDTKTLEETISYVRTCGYVDDVQYARDYIYFKKGRKSFLQIKMELQKKNFIAGVRRNCL
ncbi:MAG: regulatory protein RecX [Anaerobutyricum sp.]